MLRFTLLLRLSILWSLLLTAACGAAQEFAPETEVDTNAVDDLFAWVGSDEPGIAVAIIEDGTLTYAQGYGVANLETGDPITLATIFHLASVGKQMTGVAILLLSEAELLDYDDPIATYLPELAGPGDAVTIRHVLHHTGGIPDYDDTLEEAFDQPTNQDALDVLAADFTLDFAHSAGARDHLKTWT